MWTDKSGDAAFLKKLVSEGEELRISGIVQPREGVTATALTPGIYYTPDLVTYLIEEVATSDVVKAQLANRASTSSRGAHLWTRPRTRSLLTSTCRNLSASTRKPSPLRSLSMSHNWGLTLHVEPQHGGNAAAAA